jgi:hypothetical protein
MQIQTFTKGSPSIESIIINSRHFFFFVISIKIELLYICDKLLSFQNPVKGAMLLYVIFYV